MAEHAKEVTPGTLGAAAYEIHTDPAGRAAIQVRRSYPGGIRPSTAQEVWRLVADFGGIKSLFPSLLNVYLTYPDASDRLLNTVRHMIFASPDGKSALPFGVEQVVSLDARERRLEYISVLGMPVTDYRSVMAVTGDDACELYWTSTCKVTQESAAFLPTLAAILSRGANQIAAVLGVA